MLSLRCVLAEYIIPNTVTSYESYGVSILFVEPLVQANITETWWRHQMETFSALLALYAGNSPVPVNSPHKGQWRGALMFSLIYAWINDWVNNRQAGDLRRYCCHYDVNVMKMKLHFSVLLWGESTGLRSVNWSPMDFPLGGPVMWRTFSYMISTCAYATMESLYHLLS